MYGLHLDFHTCIKMVYLIITQQITDMAINPHEIGFSSHVDWDIQHPSERWCWNLQKSHQSRLCKRKICSWTLACRSASHIWLTPQWIGTWPLHDQEMAGKKKSPNGSHGWVCRNSAVKQLGSLGNIRRIRYLSTVEPQKKTASICLKHWSAIN